MMAEVLSDRLSQTGNVHLAMGLQLVYVLKSVGMEEFISQQKDIVMMEILIQAMGVRILVKLRMIGNAL